MRIKLMNCKDRSELAEEFLDLNLVLTDKVDGALSKSANALIFDGSTLDCADAKTLVLDYIKKKQQKDSGLTLDLSGDTLSFSGKVV